MTEILQQTSGSFRSYALLAAFIVGVFGIGSAIGITLSPGAWYAGLTKPWFNPPNWLFGPVWSVLYVLIAIAGWRTVRADTDGTQTMLWFLQMALNFAWTPVVFGLHLLWPGFVVLAGMWLSIAAFIYVAWINGDHTSSWLFSPYIVWVTMAGILNVSLAVLNPAQ